jgi:malonyl-ACP decarboxylase
VTVRRVAVVGLGVQCAIADGVAEFSDALRSGVNGVTRREPCCGLLDGPGAWLPAAGSERARTLDSFPGELGRRAASLLRRSTRSVQFGLLAACEAWQGSGCTERDAETSAIVVGGTNQSPMQGFQQGLRHAEDPLRVRPGYAAQLWDTHLVAVCSEVLGMRHEGVTVGGASAAGNVALIEAMRRVRLGLADRCLVVMPPTELSPVEHAALAQIGSLHPDDGTPVEEMSRPFDAARRGFVLGEGAAAVVLEAEPLARARGVAVHGFLEGGAIRLHGTRSTDPSADGEARAIRAALQDAGVAPGEVDYVSAHATSTKLGDEVEMQAVRMVLGDAAQAAVNSTKSLVGHCLGAAAGVELIACLQQMAGGFVHPNLNLVHPDDDRLMLVGATAAAHPTRVALKNSFGFGGINTSLVVRAGGVAAWR